ncbi:serine, glycine and glutamine-rich protein-like [Corticium candelabrum]|uniref:serine, glycine and glutamine-rich protein-like n=1 Tax=Corticium candelabrum TaxID=121492 RepID=UPI002E272251|nr:serine, glycine and glutamine-rich protein-like [Corticium candelabrum]
MLITFNFYHIPYCHTNYSLTADALTQNDYDDIYESVVGELNYSITESSSIGAGAATATMYSFDSVGKSTVIGGGGSGGGGSGGIGGGSGGDGGTVGGDAGAAVATAVVAAGGGRGGGGRIQYDSLFRVVGEAWRIHQETVFAITEGRSLAVSGDRRCDSPGFSANNGSYTVIEEKSRVLISFQHV